MKNTSFKIKFFISFTVASVLFIFSTKLYSNENSNPRPKKDTIIIYNFQTIDNTEKYRYYSFIIPQTVTKNLIKTNRYRINRIRQKLALPSNETERTVKLQSIGIKKNAGFIITGDCIIKDNSLKVKLQIYNVKGNNTKELFSESREVGALLRDTIDQLSGDIEEKVIAFQNENRQRFDRSSIHSFIKTIEGLTIGFEGGGFFILGFMGTSLRDNYYIRPFIYYPLFDYLGISLNMDYLSTDSKSQNEAYDRDFSLFAPTVDVHLILPLTSFLNISLAIGFGPSFTRVRSYISPSGGPFSDPYATTRTTTPYFTSSIAFEFTFGPLFIRTGTSYKRAFIFTKHLQLATAFMGIGYRF